MHLLSIKSPQLGQTALEKQQRARDAMACIAPFVPINGLRTFSRKSDLCFSVNGVQILVSYSDVVAFRLPNGASYSIPAFAFSATTQRSIDEFCPDREEIPVAELHTLLAHILKQ